MPRYDIILLDADNTIWDFDAAEEKALVHTFLQYQVPDTEENRSYYLAENKALWAGFERGEYSQEWLTVERFDRLFIHLGLPRDGEAANQFYLAALGEQGDLLDGAEEFCHTLAQHCTLAIVTNGMAVAQRGRFAHCGLHNLMSGLYISQELGVSKPHASFFEHVLQDMKIQDKARVLVVGDTLGSDILGAKNAGLDSVWFNPKEKPGRADLQPNLEVRTHREITEWILQDGTDTACE